MIFFTAKPDVWVMVSSEDTIIRHSKQTKDFNGLLCFADVKDPVEYCYLETNLLCDYLCFDQMHFKGHTCAKILNSFVEYVNKNQNFDFKDYGNNSIMWYPPRYEDGAGFCIQESQRACCDRIQDRLTVQEMLQSCSGCKYHYSTGDTVALHAIAIAIIAGCNPIYLTGMDLDYGVNYANGTKVANASNYSIWRTLSHNLLNDLDILNISARARGIEIINLKKNAWYKTFKEDDEIKIKEVL